MRDSLKVPALLDLSHTLAAPLLEKFDFPWEALPEISAFILTLSIHHRSVGKNSKLKIF